MGPGPEPGVDCVLAVGGAPWGPAPQAASQAVWVMGLPGRTPPALLAPGVGCVTGTGAWGPLPGDRGPAPHPSPSVLHPILPCFTHCSEVVSAPWLSLEPRPAAQLMDGRRAPRGLSRAGWTSR